MKETVTVTANQTTNASGTYVIIPQTKYDLTISNIGSGDVELDLDGGTYDSGTEVVLTASAEPGWVFSSWSGDLISSDNPATITMNSNKNVTATFLVDSDNDGISDKEEDSGPNSGDGNNDGIPDRQQGNVSSLRTYDDRHSVTVETPPGIIISNCKAIDSHSSNGAPSNVDFPYGFFEFTIEGVDAGGETMVTLYLPEGSSYNTYYKFGPTSDDDSNHWYEFRYAGRIGARINRDIIKLHFIDGLRGDDDLEANGIIIDMGGPGKSGGNGLCFISTAKQGSLAESLGKMLRDFRDRFLMTNILGKSIGNFYCTDIRQTIILTILIGTGLLRLVGYGREKFFNN